MSQEISNKMSWPFISPAISIDLTGKLPNDGKNLTDAKEGRGVVITAFTSPILDQRVHLENPFIYKSFYKRDGNNIYAPDRILYDVPKPWEFSLVKFQVDNSKPWKKQDCYFRWGYKESDEYLFNYNPPWKYYLVVRHRMGFYNLFCVSERRVEFLTVVSNAKYGMRLVDFYINNQYLVENPATLIADLELIENL